MNDPYVTPAAPLRAMADALVRGGVRDVVICPGSRSTPMALALRATPALRCWVHLDERAGAYFALGAAKAGRRPAAILVTSGTAAVNLAPAVAEARYGRVPLVALTADRPPELQGRGAAQTIDQADLFGRHAKWWAQVPVPESSPSSAEAAMALVERGLEVAMTAPAGPVQLDLPFREPLLPDGSLVADVTRPDDGAGSPVPVPVTAADVERAERTVSGIERGLIVVGPIDLPGLAEAVASLAAATGFPILADGLANVRVGAHERSHVIAHHDALLRTPLMERLPPELVLRFGATPTSKALDRWLTSSPAGQLLIDDGGGWERPPEPDCVRADPAGFARALARRLTAPLAESAWLARWRAADAAAGEALASWRAARQEPFEGAIFESLEAAVPGSALVVVASSMPVRDLDTFMPSSGAAVRIIGNRGVNGIDGLVSTALGVAAAQEHPVLAVVGDLGLLHDLNAFIAAHRLGLALTVVLLDNDGGGIFSFLPQAAAEQPGVGLPAAFEELFGTPHGIDLGPLVRAMGAEHRRVTPAELVPAVRGSLGRPGVQVVELRTDRARNVELHREALAAVSRAVESVR